MSDIRKKEKNISFKKKINTLGAEYPVKTNYRYMTYKADKDDLDIKEKYKVQDITIPKGSYAEVEVTWVGIKGKNEVNIVVK